MRVHDRRIASLLPYALASVAVVLASAIAIGTTIRPIGPTGPGVPVATAEPTAGPRAVGAADARMGYWRAAASGLLELWASDLDGDHRSRIATAGANTDLGLTRWSPDGSAVGYTIGGTTIGIAWADATHATLSMPSQLSQARWRIVSFEWSPDAKRVAATFRAGSGLSNESDVYVAEALGSATWERVTTLGDAFAGRWIDADRLFVETASGLVAVLDLATKALRPITGMPVTSPIVGRDGRVYFTGGRSVAADVATQPVASGWVWSATIDGDDLRRETSAEQAQARLFGLLADGRAITGVPGGVYFAADALVPLAFVGAGTVRRVVVTDDGRRAIGITDSRILQIEPTKVPRTLALGSLPPTAAATTLLSGLRDADVWVARKATPLARELRAPAGPQAKLAFTLGRALWQMDPDGSMRLLLTGGPSSFITAPKWSPSGDQLAASVGDPRSSQSTAVVLGPAGGTQRWPLPANAGGLQWSPDGRSIAFWSSTGPRFDEWTTQLYDPATGRAGERAAGRVAWSGGVRLSLSDGEPEAPVSGQPPSQVRTWQRIELIDGAAKRTITDARRLAASPLLRDVPDAAQPALISEIVPSSDPAYAGVWLGRSRQSGPTRGVFVVVRIADGEPVYVSSLLPGDAFGPLAYSWSPSGHLFGYDLNDGPAGAAVRRSVVVDPVSGRMIVRVDGRFAGWTADGQWAYVARDEGLFAYRSDGTGDGVRISSIGVPVVATRP